MAVRKPGEAARQRQAAGSRASTASSGGTRKEAGSSQQSKAPRSGVRRPGQTGTSGDGRKSTRRSESRLKKKSKLPFVLIGAVGLVCLLFFSSYLSYTYLVDRYKNPLTAESIQLDMTNKVIFKIAKGSGTKEIAASLKDMGLIKNEAIYRFLSKFNGYDGNYNAGTYTLCDGLSYEEIMVILTGSPDTVTVTFPEGFSIIQMAERLEAKNVVSADAFLKAVQTADVSSYDFIEDFSSHDYRLEGYLFPDTYEFGVDCEPETVIYKMLNRFREVFLPKYYEQIEELGYSLNDVITMASIVEREAKLASERKTIAGVFYNRLSHSEGFPKLQSCATVQYVHKKLYNKTLVKISYEDILVDDPYNTYQIDGLPPGPICNPGLAAIKAALYPEEHKYYFFVAKADESGGHVFSKTAAEHEAAKKAQNSDLP